MEKKTKNQTETPEPSELIQAIIACCADLGMDQDETLDLAIQALELGL